MTKVISMAIDNNDDYLEAKIISDADIYIPYSLEEVEIDFSVVGKNTDKEGEVLLATCRKEVIDQILSAVGLEPSIVDIKIYDVERSFSLIENKIGFENNEVIALFELNTGLSLTVMQQGEAIYHRVELFIMDENKIFASTGSALAIKKMSYWFS